MRIFVVTIILFCIALLHSGDCIGEDSCAGLEGVFAGSNDSVIFDLTAAHCNADEILFPVYINSDEEVFAVDFAMQYDVTKIAFDSLIIYNSQMSVSANYNSSDSTLRVSSFSGQKLVNDTALIALRFRKILLSIDSIGFSNVSTFINGDSCSNRFTDYFSRPAITPVGPLVIYPGDSITLNVAPVTGLNYLWSTGDTSTSIMIVNDGTYSVTATNSNGCIMEAFITIDPGTVLPVELLYFSANSTENRIVLEWTTASEKENDFFTIERSVENGWKIVAITVGSGSTNVSTHYIAYDDHPEPGFNYYRLKQTDYNGSESVISSAVAFFGRLNSDQPLVYPNPFQEIFNLHTDHEAEVAVYDLNGRELPVTIIDRGNRMQVSMPGSGSGTYLLIIQCRNEIFRIRLLKNIP